ncbi:periodic tryptophan protein 2 homolog [Ornithodoros turicata]|uniref:periodic tryptophan protein 2 homolog n=1 Tax=Ornithodoros turicata TaxID=34597 RepID=UPI00313A0FAA
MKFAFKFSNLIGTVYRKGNVLFTPDGNTVITPVGNRLSLFDLRNNKSETLPIESRYNFTSVAIAPNGCILIAVNETGEALLCSLVSRTAIHRQHFRKPVNAVKFSPNGKYFAVTKDNCVFVYRTPGHAREFRPFALERVLTTAYDETTCIDWSTDSRVLAVGSKDMTTKVISLHRMTNFSLATLGSHSDVIIKCFFEKDSLDLYTLSKNGQLCIWECSHDLSDLISVKEPPKVINVEELDEDETSTKTPEESDPAESKVSFRRIGKHFMKDSLKTDSSNVSLLSADYHQASHLLVTGYSNGSFLLHEMPDFNLINSLSIADHDILSVTFNCTGEWIALASGRKGQLVVWEWQSESFVLKQQGHINNMACLTYSPDGLLIATGGDDGRVKLWNVSNGFCFVTFTEHKSGVTAVKFTQSGKAVMSASLDGTIRAFDLHRYRNFKTLTTPQPAQFSCLAVDPSGEVVCAGSQDTFDIFVWSLQTGRLLDVLAGHQGPVSGITFSPNEAILVSASWDKTCRVWDVFGGKGSREAITLTADGLTAVFRPDGREFAAATLDGSILFFNPQTSAQTGSIEGRYDLTSGRRDTDLVTAKKLTRTQAFSTLCYTADGENILAAGRSKFVCIYNVLKQLLLKKFEITCNHSLDGVDDFISRRKITEFGNIALVEERDNEEEAALALPGAKKGDMSSRSFKPEVRVASVAFSPTGRAWGAATTEGILVYSLDHSLVFDPYELEQDITPASIRQALDAKDYSKAVMTALRLNEAALTTEIVEKIPLGNIELLCRALPQVYVERLLGFLGVQLESRPHIQFYMTWITTLLKQHGEMLKERSPSVMAMLRTLVKNITLRHKELAKICEHNTYLMRYIIAQKEVKEKEEARKKSEEVSGSEASDTDDEDVLMAL